MSERREKGAKKGAKKKGTEKIHQLLQVCKVEKALRSMFTFLSTWMLSLCLQLFPELGNGNICSSMVILYLGG